MYFLHFTIIHNVVSVQCRNMTRAVCRPGDLPDHPYLYPHHAHHHHQQPPPQRKSSVIVRNNRNISSLPSSSPAPAPALVSPCGPPPPRLPASPDSEAGAGAGRHRAQHDWLKQLQSLRKIIVKSQNRLLIEFILTQTLLLTLEFFIDTAIQFPNFNTVTIRDTTVK